MTTAQLDTPVVSRRFWSGMTLLVCALLVAPMVASQLGGNYWVRVIDFALLYVMLALGLNIVVGYTGLLDMGFIAFYAVGAYLAALLASPHLLDVFPILNSWFPDGLHTSWLVIIPLAALVAAGCGIVLGAPTLKLRGEYLAIVTLGFGEIIRILMRNLDRPVNITNGAKGISGVDSLNLFGLKFSGVYHWFGFKVPALWLWYYLLMLVIVAIIFVCLRLQHSRIGRAWHAIREDEDQPAELQTAGFRYRRLIRRRGGRAVRRISGLRFAGILYPAGVDCGPGDGSAGRDGAYPRRDPRRGAADRAAGAAAQPGGAGTAGAVWRSAD